MSGEMWKIEDLLNAIASERTSVAGRAAVQLALQMLLTDSSDVRKVTEARAWVVLGLECDKAIKDGQLAEALEKAKRKGLASEKLDRAKAVASGVTFLKDRI